MFLFLNNQLGSLRILQAFPEREIVLRSVVRQFRKVVVDSHHLFIGTSLPSEGSCARSYLVPRVAINVVLLAGVGWDQISSLKRFSNLGSSLGK